VENLPYGVDGVRYRWADFEGEGIPGIFTEQAEAWFYKPNLGNGKFGPMRKISAKPSLAALSGGRQQLLDLAGDGQLDVVEFDGPIPGFYERTPAEGWENFRPFTLLPNLSWRNPNLRFVDLTGDGHPDILIAQDEVLTWYPSLAEEGFGIAEKVVQPLSEEKGPRVVFDDDSQFVSLADMSGDGLADLVRIRDGEITYWPNLGYGRFGAKVTMDNAPRFEAHGKFDPRRVRLADIDGSGTTDVIYLSADGVRIHFNHSGNSLSSAYTLSNLPSIDDMSLLDVTDLFGTGTACLVLSSSLPGDSARPMYYIDLMAGKKPHLLIRVRNNLGAETKVCYASSTKFYLADKAAGRPRITLLPFPVSVVERVETYDWIGRNRFTTRYAYHFGNHDGIDREFRGFGMVEQWDTQEFAVLSQSGAFPIGSNVDATSHVPPVHSKTWFHTGVYLGRDHISDFFAGLLDGHDIGEYYREPGITDDQARALLLEDTVLPAELTLEEEREACRALKGSLLRQEVYALDGTPRAPHPYAVTEQNFTVRFVQPRCGSRHAVFFVHAREVISYHYERHPTDPRSSHSLTLAVDNYGNVLKSLSIGYGRRLGSSPLEGDDRMKQEQTLVKYTERNFTNAIDDTSVYPESYRTPLPSEARTFEVTGVAPVGAPVRLKFSEVADKNFQSILSLPEIEYEQPTNFAKKQRRLIEHVRTFYRPDDLGMSRDDVLRLLPLRTMEPLALPGEIYKLAFTRGLLAQVFQRNGQSLLPNAASVLGGRGPGGGGYLSSQQLKSDGRFPDSDRNDDWWIPASRVFYSPYARDAAAKELAYACQHFFLPLRYRDSFHTDSFSTESFITFDTHDLLILESRDPLGNRVTVGERKPNGDLDPARPGNDYRVLQPWRVMDPNRNRTQVAFDALGMVVGTAAMGKPEERRGDSLAGFVADLSEAVKLNHVTNPLVDPSVVLGRATTRLVFDMFAYYRSRNDPQPAPLVVYILARITHDAELEPEQQTRVEHSFSYSDGFGREIQKKLYTETEKVDGVVSRIRWLGSGWTILNNKGDPVRQYEPFFSVTHDFESSVQAGISSVLFYDPLERVVATLHPNHTYEKVVFNPWQVANWDENDTVLQADPRDDPDVGDFFRRLAVGEFLPTWYSERNSGSRGNNEQISAIKAAAHNQTPSIAHFDPLGRRFLRIAHNRFLQNGSSIDEDLRMSISFDIEDNQREIVDARMRSVMRLDYDMLGNRIREASMEAGELHMLNDAKGKPIYVWRSRGHTLHTVYDALRRPVEVHLLVPSFINWSIIERVTYGESQSTPEVDNLRLRIYQVYDGAGKVTNVYDFKGNLWRTQRELAGDYRNTLDWSSSIVLEPTPYSTSSTYDALNRPKTRVTHDKTIVRLSYNEADLLQRVEASLRDDPTPAVIVKNIEYNARGQRKLVEYGNGAISTFEYDSLTFRLARLTTIRGTERLQDLAYTYDPVGNTTCIVDAALQTNYYNGEVVGPQAKFTYDAIYRLTEATGRELIGQTAPSCANWNDESRTGLPHPNDGSAMRNYTEDYRYDQVGNILRFDHYACGGSWTRIFEYLERSLLEPTKYSNRLTWTKCGNATAHYVYDGHGNMNSMPHLSMMQWNEKDQLRATSQQRVNNGGTPEITYYVYDASGERVRKVTERYAAASEVPTRMKERIYLGEFEIFRKYNSTSVTLERETLSIMFDKERFVLVETLIRDQGIELTPSRLIRYQFNNHLGSVGLELDDEARIISYEEYTAYGSTSYQAVRSQTEAPKRYRYTGKERDEESGLCYHGARYYAPWLTRWVSPDPASLVDGQNLYIYVRDNPVIRHDPDGRQQEETQAYYGTIPSGLSKREAIEAINSGIGVELGIKITDIRQSGSDWHITKWEPIREESARQVDVGSVEEGKAASHADIPQATGGLGGPAKGGANKTSPGLPMPGIVFRGLACHPDERYFSHPVLGVPVLRPSEWLGEQSRATIGADKGPRWGEPERRIDPDNIRPAPGILSKNEALDSLDAFGALQAGGPISALAHGRTLDEYYFYLFMAQGAMGLISMSIYARTGMQPGVAGKGGYRDVPNRRTATQEAVEYLRTDPASIW
jgi:RHS repeat-associated protein